MALRSFAPSSVAALLGMALLACLANAAQSATGVSRIALEAGDRIIVKWRGLGGATPPAVFDVEARRLSAASGQSLTPLRSLGGGLQLLNLAGVRSPEQINKLLATLRSSPQVELAEPDGRVRAHAYTPNDPLYSGQWYLQAQQVAAIRANSAWDITKGAASPSAASVVIAVVDTGVRFDHPDLRRAASGGKLLPGYDFVSADSGGVFATANDGDGWDPDPSDPGDYLTAADLAGLFKGKKCGGGANQDQPTNSSWHGTRVSGLIAADSDNATGITGAAFNLRVLPVRALGKCGGYDSDVLAAMYWAAGMTIPAPLFAGAPPQNPYPAQVINLSLGSAGACSALYTQAVKDITAHGVLIVASAGNDGGPVDEPANCPGVLAVAGLRHAGTKVGYSNLGPEVGLSAPAGNCVNTAAGSPCLFTLDTTTDSGTQAPAGAAYTDQYNSNVGTSFSAPLASATAGLMVAVNAHLTPLQLIARMQAAAASFPTQSDNTPQPPACHVPVDKNDVQNTECICTTGICGSGMLDTQAAVTAALRPSAIATLTGTVGTGHALALDGSASGAATGRSIAGFAWSVVSTSGGAAAPTFGNAAAAVTNVLSPTAGSYTLRLTVTDSAGATDSADITVNAATSGGTVTASSPPATSGSGGGGSLGVELVALALLAAARGQRRSTPPASRA